MTTATGTLLWRCATDAENYDWIKKISDAFTAVGFVKASDTGQINLSGSTVPLPASPTVTYKESGYEIRKLERSGYPTLYCRVGYGMSRSANYPASANANVPRMRFQWATVTDGAGNLSGLISTATSTSSGYAHSAEEPQVIQRPYYFASDGQNWLTGLIDPQLVGAVNTTTSGRVVPLCIANERTIDPATGLHDADGFVMLTNSVTITTSGVAPNFNFSDMGYQFFNIEWNTKHQLTTIAVQATSMSFTSSNTPGETPLMPITIHLPKVKGPPGVAFFYYYLDIADGYMVDSEVYGETRTYITAGVNSGPNAQANSANMRLAIRYD